MQLALLLQCKTREKKGKKSFRVYPPYPALPHLACSFEAIPLAISLHLCCTKGSNSAARPELSRRVLACPEPMRCAQVPPPRAPASKPGRNTAQQWVKGILWHTWDGYLFYFRVQFLFGHK